ncbi:MAG: hypothetical protein AAF985_26430, partial [Bacteroidota bacterium]
LFPTQAFQDVKIRLLMSDLFKLLEKYLSYINQEQKEETHKIDLASIYRKRKLPKHFEKTIRQIKNHQQKQAIRDNEYYDRLYQIQLEEYEFHSSLNRTEVFNLQALSDTIDLAYLSKKLKRVCFLLSHQSVYKTEYDFGLLHGILNQIEDSDYLQVPAVAVYYYGIFLLKGQEKAAHFTTFKQLLFDQGHCFPHTEIRDLYLLALNYCIKKVNAGAIGFIQEGLDLFKMGLEKELLVENGLLSRFSYNNIVALGLRNKEYDWIEQFINQYRSKLDRKFRERTYSLAMARLQYERKAYSEALQHLQKAEYKDLLTNLIAKTLQVKIFYELKEFDLLESHLQTLKTFIRRKKAISYHQQNYLNLVRYTQKLLKLNPYDKKAKETLKVAIENEEILSERNWLLQQLVL